MNEFVLSDLLPMAPWEGPPLPRFLGIYWPSRPENLLPVLPKKYISDIAEREVLTGEVLDDRMPATNYANEESWEITWSAEGLPTKVVVHRNATRKEV
jgi:hypothetical protein